MTSIKHLFHIAASREEVYEAISTVNGLQNWWTTGISGESGIGGILLIRFGEMGPDFKVTDLKENQEVKWECIEGHPGWAGSTMTFTLDENEGKTRVRFAHEGLEGSDDMVASINFTWARYLVSLRQLCQTNVGQAFGSKTYVQ